MGRPVILTATVVLVVLIFALAQHSDRSESSALRGEPVVKEKERQWTRVPVEEKRGRPYVGLNALRQHLRVESEVDGTEGTIRIRDGKTELELLKGTTVLSRNGRYLPADALPVIQGQEVWVPAEVVEKGLDRPVRIRKGGALVGEEAVPASALKTADAAPRNMDAGEIAEYLAFLDSPVQGARVSIQDSHLPGAPRTYRNGVHEGLDYYSGSSGIPIDRQTPVVAAAAGTVVRVDRGYSEMEEAERNALLAWTAGNDGQTPAHILDKMRGRSVWIQHEKGVLTRYVHLDSTEEGLAIGSRVKKGDRLGTVGNSGTTDGVAGNERGLHLHFDLLIDDEWFWERYTPEERRTILERVLDVSNEG